MNNIYVYDGTFINLLNLIKYLSTFNIKNINIKKENHNFSLFDKEINLNIPSKENIVEEIITDIGTNNFNALYYTYLSNENNKENIMYFFYMNAKYYKNTILGRRNLNCVRETLKIIKYVKQENHKYKGFTRFKELNGGILYAEIEPNNNIIFLLSKHFKNRLKNEYWIIKDVRRNLFSIYDKNSFKILNDIYLKDINFSNDEKDTQNMWKTFYNTIGIKERKNDRCRMNFMPKRYWKYILEMDDENEKNS